MQQQESSGWKTQIVEAIDLGDRRTVQHALDLVLSKELGSEFDDELVSAVLRYGNPSQLQALQQQRGRASLDFLHPVVEQVAVLAEQGQADWIFLEQAIRACEWLDNRPTRGLQPLSIPVSNQLSTVASFLGAQHVFFGRPIRPGDRKGLDDDNELLCRDMVWMTNHELPVRLPRLMVFVAVDAVGPIYISIRPEDGQAFAFSSNQQADAERLLEAGLWWDVADDGREEQVNQVHGATYRSP